MVVCVFVIWCCCVFFVKQKTAYEMRISDWSSDVCSSDLRLAELVQQGVVVEGVVDGLGGHGGLDREVEWCPLMPPRRSLRKGQSKIREGATFPKLSDRKSVV